MREIGEASWHGSCFHKGHGFLESCSQGGRGFHGGSVGRIHLPVQETRIRSLGGEDPLEKEMATHSTVYPLLGNPMDRGAWHITTYSPRGGGLGQGGGWSQKNRTQRSELRMENSFTPKNLRARNEITYYQFPISPSP